jgi:hypothetical protein
MAVRLDLQVRLEKDYRGRLVLLVILAVSARLDLLELLGRRVILVK